MDVLTCLVFFCLAFTASASGLRIQPRADQEVCYGELGCFTTADPWTSTIRPLSALPESPATINTRFLLYTRTNPSVAVQLTTGDASGLSASPYDATKRTLFLIHGWTNDANHAWIQTAQQEILAKEDVNIIRVDWAPGAGLPYLRALTNTQVVGAELGSFISFIRSALPLNLADVHLIGHDLGAHAASYAGYRLPGIGRITGLDPSTIYFEGADPLVSLDPTDALLVDVVHTDAPYNIALGRDHVGMGFATSLGHVDIYVNNGLQQPGCEDRIDEVANTPDKLVTMTDLDGPIDQYVCSHMRSVEYFVESINSVCPFTAFYCSSWEYFLRGVCYSTCPVGSKSCTALGYHAGSYPGRGNFYMDTQSTAPYCNEVVRTELNISSSQVDTDGTIDYILIGDVGQTKEAPFYSGPMKAGDSLQLWASLPGSNPFRIGHVESVRLLYKKALTGENEVIVSRANVQQAYNTINAVDNLFQGAVLPDTTYVTLIPQ